MIPTILPDILPLAPTTTGDGADADAFAALFATHPPHDLPANVVGDGEVEDVVAAAAVALAGLHAFAFGTVEPTAPGGDLPALRLVPGTVGAAGDVGGELADEAPSQVGEDVEVDEGIDLPRFQTTDAEVADASPRGAPGPGVSTPRTLLDPVEVSAAADGGSDDVTSPETPAGDGLAAGDTDQASSADTPDGISTRPVAGRADIGAMTEPSSDPAVEDAAPVAAREAARRTTAAPATTSTSTPSVPHVADAAAADATSPVSEQPATEVREAGSAAATATVRRVLQALRELQDAPPPRVVVIDTGEARLRLGLGDDGVVHLRLLDAATPESESLLRELDRALEDRGVAADLGDRDADAHDHDHAEDGEVAAAPADPRRPSLAADRGLRL